MYLYRVIEEYFDKRFRAAQYYITQLYKSIARVVLSTFEKVLGQSLRKHKLNSSDIT